MIPFILLSTRGCQLSLAFEIFACFHYLCLDPFKVVLGKAGSPPDQVAGLFGCFSNGFVAFRYRNLVVRFFE